MSCGSTLATRGRIARRFATMSSVDAPPFFSAEDSHQQYLGKKSGCGYCGLGGCGVEFKAPKRVETTGQSQLTG